MELPTIEDILTSIDAFLARHDMAVTRFGREATGEPQLIDSMRTGGRVPNLTTLHRMKAYMDAKDAERAAAADHADSDTTGDAASSCGKNGGISASAEAA